MHTVGLRQSVQFATHQKGNILDLIFHHELDVVDISDVCSGAYISDHKLVFGWINIKKKLKEDEVRSVKLWNKVDRNWILDKIEFEICSF